MEAETQRVLREKIATAIEETRAQISSLEESSVPVEPDNAIGRLSRMDAIGNKSVAEASLRNARARLAKLRYALDNIGKQGFGCCAECEEDIPVARIMAMPESTLCVSCAEEIERSDRPAT